MDFDLHTVRKPDAEALEKFLLRKTHDNDLRPETRGSDNLIPHLANDNELRVEYSTLIETSNVQFVRKYAYLP